MTNCVLIIDARERHVTRHHSELEGITKEIKQITTGDYVVLAPTGNILAVIERKSLEDFAASIKDGRADNRRKLVELRAQVGCRIVYIIEGPEFPKQNDSFGNIPYPYIESAIFHLMIRDGVVVIRTKDSLDTAKALKRFMMSMDNLCRNEVLNCDSVGTEQPQIKDLLVDASRDTIMSMLTKKHEKTDQEVAREMWSQFPGISVESADEYISRWSIADIVCGRIPRDTILNTKMANGRKISKKASASLSGINKIIEARLLQSVPGVSHATAVVLTNKTPLKSLLSYSSGALAIQTVNDNGRKLGDKLAEKILKYFNYKNNQQGGRDQGQEQGQNQQNGPHDQNNIPIDDSDINALLDMI